MTTIIGIDPGKSGAVAVHYGTDQDVYQIPTMPKPGSKSAVMIDELSLRDNLMCANKPHAFIETQQPMHGHGSKGQPIHGGTKTAFSTGDTFGLIRGLCVGLRIPYTLVHPRTWQAVMLAGMNAKGREDVGRAMVIVAGRLFPTVSLLPTPKCKKLSIDMAAALLIAEFGRRTLNR